MWPEYTHPEALRMLITVNPNCIKLSFYQIKEVDRMLGEKTERFRSLGCVMSQRTETDYCGLRSANIMHAK